MRMIEATVIALVAIATVIPLFVYGALVSNRKKYEHDYDVDFFSLGWELQLPGEKPKRNIEYRNRMFKSWYGTKPDNVRKLWNRLYSSGWMNKLTTSEPKHLLWALHLMKVYNPTEEVLAARMKCDAKTFRKYSWFFIEAISREAPKLVR